MADLEMITTSDGSHTLFNTELNETYHSVHGAIQESLHVFIKNGLQFFESSIQPAEIKILEIGFGTGLNALLTLQYALETGIKIHYTSLEAYPLGKDIPGQLNYPALLNTEKLAGLFQNLHEASWDKESIIINNFTLVKLLIRLQEADLGLARFDLVYYDAFAPSKQPEMWELSILRKVEQSMKPGAILVTYCAKGQVKRDLKSLGLLVETLPGPPGKKEMVRAVKS